MRTGQPQHSRVKLPAAVAFIAVATALAVFSALTGRWVDLAIGVIGDVYFGAAVVVVLLGRRNPWWMRSPLDPRQPGGGKGPE